MIKIEYTSPVNTILDCPCYVGEVKKGDIIEVDKEVYTKKLKNYMHNKKPVWVEVKAEKPIPKTEELQPKDS